MNKQEVKAALTFSNVIWNKIGDNFPVTASLNSKTGEVTTQGYPSQYYDKSLPIPFNEFASEYEINNIGSWAANVEAVKAKLVQEATLRDHFAGLAMQGWFSSFSPEEDHPSKTGMAEDIAHLSYRVADAMLKAREEK